jgi:hypothetical protein
MCRCWWRHGLGFAAYLILKGLGKIWKIEFFSAVLIGLGIAILIYFIVKPIIAPRAAATSATARPGSISCSPCR